MRANRGRHRLTPQLHLELACRILGQRHLDDVSERMEGHLGDRAARMGRPDLGRNPLLQWTARLNVARRRPPLVTGLSEPLVAALGDYSGAALTKRYASADGRPMPSMMVQAQTETARWWLGAGYAATLLTWSERARRITYRTVQPVDLTLLYDDDPVEPVVIRHATERPIEGQMRPVEEVYDLRDPAAPVYRIEHEGADVTAEVLPDYAGWPDEWRDADGQPFHRIVMMGRPVEYHNLVLTEGTLTVAMRWTAWGAGTDDASHAQRHVRGMTPTSMSTDSGQTGLPTGPETIIRWIDDDADRPGDHWQDAPAFSPLETARGIREYESSMTAALGLPVSLEATGGEPTETERRAMAELIEQTYPECRRADGEVLRRAAAIVRARTGTDVGSGPFGLLYGDEVEDAIEEANPPEPPEPSTPPPSPPRGMTPPDDEDET